MVADVEQVHDGLKLYVIVRLHGKESQLFSRK